MPWTDLEHAKCVKLVERVITQSKTTHRDERALASSVQEQLDLERLSQSELNELSLLTEAVNGRDPIGVCAVATAFWQNKMILSRKLALLERKLPNSSKCAEYVKELLGPSLLPATFAGSGTTALAISSTATTELTLDHHARLISEAKFQEVCDLSIKLQRRIAQLEHESDVRKEHARALLGDAGEQENEDDRVNNVIAYATQSSQFMSEAVVTLQDLQVLLQGDGNPNANGADHVAGLLNTTLPDGVNWAILRRGPVELPADIIENPVTVNELIANSGLEHVTHVKATSDMYAKEVKVRAQRDLRASRRAADNSTNTISTTGALLAIAQQHCEVPHDVPLPGDAVVVATQIIPASGIDECLASLRKRIAHMETVEIPKFDARVIESKERIWEAEIEHMTKKISDPAAAAVHHDGVVAEYRSHLQQVEAERQRLDMALRQCRAHHDALVEGDVRTLSFLLESHAAEAVAAIAATDRTTYSARPLEIGETQQQFLARLGVEERDAYFFTTGAEDQPGGVQRMAYVPTAIPRTSLTKLDVELQQELQQWYNEHPDEAPPLGLIEQLAALRKSDAATLSELLSAHRQMFGSLAVEKLVERNALLERERDEHEAFVLHERRNADGLRSQLETLRSLSESKDRAYQELEGEMARIKEQLQAYLASPPRSKSSMPRSPEVKPEPPSLSYKSMYIPVAASEDFASTFVPQKLRGTPHGEVFEFVFSADQRIAYVPTEVPRTAVSDIEAKLRREVELLRDPACATLVDRQLAIETSLDLFAAFKSGDIARTVDIALERIVVEREQQANKTGLQKRIDTLTSQIEMLLKDAEPQRRQIADLKKELERSAKQLTDATQASATVLEELGECKSEVARLRAENWEGNAAKTEVARLKRTLEQLQQTTAKSQTEVSAVQQAADTAVAVAQTAQKEAERQARAHEATATRLAAELQRATTDLSAAHARIDELESQTRNDAASPTEFESSAAEAVAESLTLDDALAGNFAAGKEGGRFNRIVMMRMLDILRAALAKSREREREWKILLEEYERRAKSEDAQALMEANAALEKRLEAKTQLLEAQATQLDNLKAELSAVERRCRTEIQCMTDERRKLIDERNAAVKQVKDELDLEREAHRRTRDLLAND